jgi:hypothetical protein
MTVSKMKESKEEKNLQPDVSWAFIHTVRRPVVTVMTVNKMKKSREEKTYGQMSLGTLSAQFIVQWWWWCTIVIMVICSPSWYRSVLPSTRW